MAYVEHKEMSRTGRLDEKRNRFYSVRFLVRDDDPKADPLAVAGSVGIPFGHKWPAYNQAIFKTVDANPLSDSFEWWDVVFNYDTLPWQTNSITASGSPATAGQQNQEVAPEDRALTIVNIDSIEIVVPWTHDSLVPDELIVAANGEPFQDLPPRIEYRKVISFELYKTIGSRTIADSIAFEGKINADTFWGFEPKHVLCKKHNLTPTNEKELPYWKELVTLEFSAKPLDPQKILNRGTFELDNFGGTKAIMDKQGNPVTSPYPLDQFGRKLSDERIAARDFTYIINSKYEIKNFASIF